MGKNFTKITALSIVLSLVVATSVSAAGEVLTLEAEQSANASEITFFGTTDDDVVAVSCILYDLEDNEKGFKSTEVNEGEFEDTIAASAGEYVLKCANYDGGEWAEAEVEVIAVAEDPGEDEPSDEEDDADSPETGQITNEDGGSAAVSNVATWIVAGIGVAAVVIIGFVTFKKHREE